MTSKKLSRKEEEALKIRFLQRDIEAMKFCNDNGFTVYASSQQNGKVKVFKQKGEKFLPVNNIEYSQYEKNDIMAYHILIDETYIKAYEKNGKGKTKV